MTEPGKADSIAAAASSRWYMGTRMSTWWGTCTMIQWMKKLAHLGARRTVVPSICALNLVHSSLFHQRISGEMWWMRTTEPMSQEKPTNGSRTVRVSSQRIPHPLSPSATPTRLKRISEPEMNAVTIQRSRRIALTQRAGFGPTIIFFHHTWWM